MAGVGTGDVPAAADARWEQEQTSGQGYPEIRAQHHRCHRTQVAGYGRLGTEIDRTMVQTLDGTKNEGCWFGANASANATLAISIIVRRAGAAKSEVSLHTYITDKFMMPVTSFNVISGESHAANLLACSEFLIVPTEAGSVAEDMIIDTEVYHLLKFGYQKDVRRDVCNVGDETGFL